MLAVHPEECLLDLGFATPPFGMSPDTANFFPSSQHCEALGHLLFGVATGQLTMLTGEVGLGKTLLCRYLLRTPPPKTRFAYLFNPDLTYPDLLRTIYKDLLGQEPAWSALGSIQRALYDALIIQAEMGERITVIIDEAHRLNAEVLEGLRLLSNLETEKEKLLSLLLIGQPELEETLGAKALRPLSQRISVRFRLRPFRLRETTQYIRYCLQSGSNDHGVRFGTAAMALAHHTSRGVPRRINQICGRALLAAFAAGSHDVRPWMVWRAAQETSPGA